MDGHAEMGMQIVGETAHLFRLRSFRAAQAQGKADDNLSNFELCQHLPEGLKIAALVLALDRVQPLGGDAEWIGNGYADSFCTNIQGQDAAAAGCPRCMHRSIVDAGRRKTPVLEFPGCNSRPGKAE